MIPERPDFMGLSTLAKRIDCSEKAIENWVRMGTFPAPRMQGGKRLWAWEKVRKHLAGEGAEGHVNEPVDLATRIRNGTRRAAAGR